MNYLITGATGHLGQKVTRWLAKMVPQENIRLGIHNQIKKDLFSDLNVNLVKLDYQNAESVVQACENIDLVIYIPSMTYKLLDRITEFEHVITAVKKNHASLIAVSFIADQENNPFVMSPFYGYMPRRLAGSGIPYTIVKNALYADPLVPYLPELIKREHVIYPMADQAISYITQNDSAYAIAKLAIEPMMRDHGQSYLLSMERSYNMIELAYIMSRATEEKITYQPVSNSEFAHIYAAEGDGKELASMYAGGAKGLLDATTEDFRRITGREPEELEHYLRNGYQISKLHLLSK